MNQEVVMSRRLSDKEIDELYTQAAQLGADIILSILDEVRVSRHLRRRAPRTIRAHG